MHLVGFTVETYYDARQIPFRKLSLTALTELYLVQE